MLIPNITFNQDRFSESLSDTIYTIFYNKRKESLDLTERGSKFCIGFLLLVTFFFVSNEDTHSSRLVAAVEMQT
jgi:hypothetical protein